MKSQALAYFRLSLFLLISLTNIIKHKGHCFVRASYMTESPLQFYFYLCCIVAILGNSFKTWICFRLEVNPACFPLSFFFFFLYKTLQYLCLACPVQRQRWTQREMLPSDLHDKGIPCLFKMRWRGLKTELLKLNNGGCRPGPPMPCYLRRCSLWNTSWSLWSNPLSPLCML